MAKRFIVRAYIGDVPVVGTYLESGDLDFGGGVQIAPLTISGYIPSATVDVVYPGFTPLITGGVRPYTVTVSGLPSGLALTDTTTGATAGTPKTVGTYNAITYTVTDSVGTVVTLTGNTIVVAPGTPLTIQATLPAGKVGVAYSYTPRIFGGVAPYTVAVSGLPAGVTMTNAASGALGGRPAASGTFAAVTYTVTDSSGATATVTASLTIASTTLGPSTLSPNNPTYNVPYSGTISGKTEGSAYFGSGAGFAGLKITGILVEGTPSNPKGGPINLNEQLNGATNSVYVSNNVATVSVGTAIAIEGVPPSGKTGVAYSFLPTITGGSGPRTVTRTGTLPTGWIVNDATGEITGTTSVTGTFTGTLTATDSSGSASLEYSITVALSFDTSSYPARVRQTPADTGILGSADSYFSAPATILSSGPVPAAATKFSGAMIAGFREPNLSNAIILRAMSARFAWQLLGRLKPQLDIKDSGNTRRIMLTAKSFSFNNSTGARVHGHLPHGGDPTTFHGICIDTTTTNRAMYRLAPVYGESVPTDILERGTGALSTPVAASTASSVTANAATDVLTISAALYALVTTGTVCALSTSATLPLPLQAATDYWIIKTGTANQIQLASSRANALAGTAIDLTSAGTGSHTIAIPIVPNAAIPTATSGQLEVFGQSGTGFRDVEHAKFFAHFGLYIDWAAQCANQAAPYTGKTYYDVLKDTTLCEVGGRGVLKAANAYSATPDNVTTWSAAHFFFDAADGATVWQDPAGYNAGSSVKLKWTPTNSGVDVNGLRYARLSAIPAASDWAPRDVIPASKIGKAMEVMRINDTGLYGVQGVDDATKRTRIKEQLFAEFFSGQNGASIGNPANITHLNYDEFDRIIPGVNAPQYAKDSKGYINEDPNNRGNPTSVMRKWSTLSSNGQRAPTGNAEKQLYLDQGDTYYSNQNLAYGQDMRVFEFEEPISAGGSGVVVVKALPISTRLRAITGPSRIAVAGMLISYPGMLFTYGVTLFQCWRDIPSSPRDTKSGDFSGIWPWSPHGKIAAPGYGYTERDDMENLGAFQGIWPSTHHITQNSPNPAGVGGTVINHTTGFPYYKERYANSFQDPRLNGRWIEMAVVSIPPWIKGDAFGEIVMYWRFADEAHFSLRPASPGFNPYNVNTPSQNPRATLWSQQRMMQMQINAAVDPHGFYFNFADPTSEWPFITKVGHFLHACPESWRNPSLSTRTITALPGKRHRWGKEYVLGALAVSNGGTGFAASSTFNATHTLSSTPTTDETGAAISRGTTISVTTDASGVIISASPTIPGYGFKPNEAVTITVTGGTANATLTTTTIEANGGTEEFFLAGTPGDDTITGGSGGPDWIHAGAGNDLIRPGPSTSDTVAGQNRVWTGTGTNRVEVTAGAYDWIEIAHEEGKGDFTTIVIPANHTGVTRTIYNGGGVNSGWMSTVYNSAGTAIPGDKIDISAYMASAGVAGGFVDASDAYLRVVDGGAELQLSLPGTTGKMIWEGGLPIGNLGPGNFITG